MKFLIDMNLSPRWVEVFMAAGLDATHWSAIGDPRATDRSIMEWAQSNGYMQTKLVMADIAIMGELRRCLDL